MLRANSIFGFAPDFLKTGPQNPSKPPNPPGLNQRYPQAQPQNYGLVSDSDVKGGDQVNGIHQPGTKALTQAVSSGSSLSYQEYLHHIGQQFRDIRTSLGISQYQLHYQTLVPLNHIQALETGRIESLPYPVYVRGFIRKIGTALGLDGDRLADSLPELDPTKILLGSQCLLPKNPNSQIVLNRMHLCMGYFALLLISTVWLQKQENVTQTRLQLPSTSEIQANINQGK